MSLFVADANAVLATLFHEGGSMLQRFEERIGLGDRLAVPGLWHLEVTNVLLNKLRRKMMTQEDATASFEAFQNFRVRTDLYSAEPSVISHLWRLALKHQLTSYDAAYLELALRLDCPLLTDDAALLRAAAQENVKLL